MKEFWRRLFLVVGVSIAVCMWMFADLAPRVTVMSVDFAEEQKNQIRFMGYVSERYRYLASLPLETYVLKMVADSEIEAGPGWKAFAARMDKILENSKSDNGRIYAGSAPKLWFKLRAPPFNRLAPRFMQSHQHTLYLPYEKNGKTSYLRFQLHTYKSDDFALGTGYLGSMPPTRFFYPLRAWAWLPILTGLLCYFLLPWPGKDQEEVKVSRVAIVFGDIVGLGFFAFFFSLPFFICGAVQPVGCWGLLALFLWPFALVGLWLMTLNAKSGSFSIRFIPGGFHLHSPFFDEDVLYGQLEKVTPAVLKNPRWHRILSGLAALFSQGVEKTRMMGLYLLNSSASYGGLHFRFRDGRTLYLWYQDQVGNLLFKGLPQLLEQIKAMGLLDESNTIEKKGFATDIMTFSSDKKGRVRRIRPMLLLAGTPLCVLIAFLFLGKGLEARDDALLTKAASAAKLLKKDHKMIPQSKLSMPPLKGR